MESFQSTSQHNLKIDLQWSDGERYLDLGLLNILIPLSFTV